MDFFDNLISLDGIVSRKKYLVFFLIFSLIFSVLLILEVIFSGIIYLTVVDKLLGNMHFLFFPVVFLFLVVLCALTGSFVIYVSYAVKRARSFSDKPVQYVVYYTGLIIVIAGISIIGQITDLWKLFLIIYFLLFIPYLFFKDKRIKKEEQ